MHNKRNVYDYKKLNTYNSFDLYDEKDSLIKLV